MKNADTAEYSTLMCGDKWRGACSAIDQNRRLQDHRDGGVRRRILLIPIIPKVFTRALMVMPHALQHATNKLDRRLALGSHPEDLLALTAPPET